MDEKNFGLVLTFMSFSTHFLPNFSRRFFKIQCVCLSVRFASFCITKTSSAVSCFDSSFFSFNKIQINLLNYRIWLSLPCTPWFLGTVYSFVNIQNVMCTLETRVYMTNLTRSRSILLWQKWIIKKIYMIRILTKHEFWDMCMFKEATLKRFIIYWKMYHNHYA